MRFQEVTAFNALQLTGLILPLLFIILAFLQPQIKRLSTWYLIMAAEALYCGSMLLMIGSQRPDARPEFGLCLFQGALIYGAPAGLATAGFAFTLQIYLTLKWSITRVFTRILWSSRLLIIVPCLVTSLVIIIVVIIGLARPSTVQLADITLYCHLTTLVPSRIAGVVVSLSALGFFIVQTMIICLLYYHSQQSKFLQGRNLGFILRLFILDVISLSALATGIVQSVLHEYTSSGIIIYTSAVHILATVAFGCSTLRWEVLRRSQVDVEKAQVQ